MSTASIVAAQARPTRSYGAVLFHVLMIAFVIATQIIYMPARDMGPDNTWHYRFAREIVTGAPIYWAGLDGNRLFPDLIFAVVGYVISGGSLFAGWLPYFYCLFFLSIYVSLVALAATLYDEVRERRAFVLLSVAALWIFELAAPFWTRWFFDPGNHGVGLPVVFACLALVFWMNKTRHFSLAAAVAFVLAASLLIGSNRFLLLAFLVPLLTALVCLLGLRWQRGRTEEGQDSPPVRVLVYLVALVAVAGLGGYVAYKLISNLSWHKSVTYMGVQAVERNFSLTWAIEKFIKEASDFATYYVTMTRQVAVGPALLLATIPAGLFVLVRAVRRGYLSGVEENRLGFAIFTVSAAVLSIAFVLWGWNEDNEWRYRYFAMASVYAPVLFATFLVRPSASLPGAGIIGAGVLLALVALTFIPARHPASYDRAERNRRFLGQVEQLKRLAEQHTNRTPVRGLSEYWLAMDISARTDLPIDSLEPDRPQFRMYSNNVGALCKGGYSFVLRPVQRNEPKRGQIVAALGEPRETAEVEIEGTGKVEVLFYDPDLLEARVTEEGKKAARRLFPTFNCPR